MLSTLNERAASHNSCEDSIYVIEDEDFIIGGIFDGCSSGTNSAWASQTLAYMFSLEPYPYSDTAVTTVCQKMHKVMEMLELKVVNFESTCLLFFYNKATRELRIRAFGDGVYYVNGRRFEIDQNNTPDYLVHSFLDGRVLRDYLDKYPTEYYTDVDSFVICSDGINAIRENQFHKSFYKPLDVLLAKPTGFNYLKRMANILHKEKFTLGDDLSIISYASDKYTQPVTS